MKTRFNIIDKDEPCYIIAEIGNNHQGKGEDAMQLIRAAAESGANAVKFQKRNVDTLYSNEYFGMEYNGKNSFGATYGAHRRLLEPDLSWLSVANKLAQELHLDFVVTVFDIESLLLCEEQLSIDAYKIQSGDMTNHCLIKAVANTGKPYFISSGASSLDEITASFDLCSKLQTPFIMLYAVSSYPTTANKTNLYRFKQMQKLLDTETLGLSCHCFQEQWVLW
jgi:sialic acid synthase